MSLHDNDDGTRASSASSAQGHVALIFAETILHMLVEKRLLKVEEAISVIQTTAEVKQALGPGSLAPTEQTQAAIDALFRMMESFAADLEPEVRGRARLDWEENLGPG